MDRVGIVPLEPERTRLERRRGPRDRHERAALPDGHDALDLVELLDDERLDVRRSSPVGGSDGCTRSVSRTLPICVEIALRGAGLLPKTNSVEPPPMSIERNGPTAGSRPRVPPRNESAASRSPSMTSGSIRRRARARRSLRVARVADGRRGPDRTCSAWSASPGDGTARPLPPRSIAAGSGVPRSSTPFRAA